jgi:hypothetical protein
MPYVFNPFTGTFDYYKSYTFNQGGLYGVNTETLAANRTLIVNVDVIYQHLKPSVADRDVVLSTVGAAIGDRFVIYNWDAEGSSLVLKIKQGASDIDKIGSNGLRGYIYNGTHWLPCIAGSGTWDGRRKNTSFGFQAFAYNWGTAIGAQSSAPSNTVAVGYDCIPGLRAVGIGGSVRTGNYCVSVGNIASTASMAYSIALGYYSGCYRYGELSININGDSARKNNTIIVGWTKTTANNVPIVMLCAGQAARYCTVRPSSALAFRITVTARDNVANEVAMYTFEGLIKRDAANNTTLLFVNKTVLYEDDAAWDCDVTADDVNECLAITVTGDAANPTQWAARLDGVETHF